MLVLRVSSFHPLLGQIVSSSILDSWAERSLVRRVRVHFACQVVTASPATVSSKSLALCGLHLHDCSIILMSSMFLCLQSRRFPSRSVRMGEKVCLHLCWLCHADVCRVTEGTLPPPTVITQSRLYRIRKASSSRWVTPTLPLKSWVERTSACFVCVWPGSARPPSHALDCEVPPEVRKLCCIGWFGWGADPVRSQVRGTLQFLATLWRPCHGLLLHVRCSVWNADTGKLLHSIRLHHHILSLDFHPSEHALVIACGKQAFVWYYQVKQC